MVTTLAARPPFRLDLTANALRRLSTNVVDRFDGTTYRRLVGHSGAPAVLRVMQTGPSRLVADVEGGAFDPAVLVERIFGTTVELEPFYRSAAAVEWLAPLVRAARGVKPPRYPSLWEACVNAIVYQQVSIHAAGAILRRLIERYSRGVTVDGTVLHVFPGAQFVLDADADELRRIGLSIQKITALRAVARALGEGEIDESALSLLPTPELTAELVRHRGIGPWTAAVIALRGFGRLDVFPMRDSGVARSVRQLAGAVEVDVDALLSRLGAQRGMLYYHLLLGRLAARGDIAF